MLADCEATWYAIAVVIDVAAVVATYCDCLPHLVREGAYEQHISIPRR